MSVVVVVLVDVVGTVVVAFGSVCAPATAAGALSATTMAATTTWTRARPRPWGEDDREDTAAGRLRKARLSIGGRRGDL